MPGGSRLLLEAVVPYDLGSLAAFLGVEPARCVVIEDAPAGLAAAKAAGMLCVALRNGFNDEQDLSAGDLLEINPVDAAPRGLDDGGIATIRSRRGEIKLPVQVTSSTSVAGKDQPPLFTKPEEQKVAQIAWEVIKSLESQPDTVPTVAHLKKPVVQAAIVKAGKEAGAYGRQIESSEDEAKLVRMESEGKLKRVPFAGRDQMKRLVDPVMAEYAKEIGADAILAKINAIK